MKKLLVVAFLAVAIVAAQTITVSVTVGTATYTFSSAPKVVQLGCDMGIVDFSRAFTSQCTATLDAVPIQQIVFPVTTAVSGLTGKLTASVPSLTFPTGQQTARFSVTWTP